jgi:hypothetical protein
MEDKVCPFCRQEAIIQLSNDRPSYYRVHHTCIKEGKASITINTKWCKTEKEALELWNERME